MIHTEFKTAELLDEFVESVVAFVDGIGVCFSFVVELGDLGLKPFYLDTKETLFVGLKSFVSLETFSEIVGLDLVVDYLFVFENGVFLVFCQLVILFLKSCFTLS